MTDRHRSLTYLADDIEGALEDHAFCLSGGTIRYAVDYSEIKAYVKLAESDDEAWLAMNVFQDDDRLSLAEIHRSTLEFLLNQSDKPILLPEYSFELTADFSRLSSTLLPNLSTGIKKAQEEALVLLQSPKMAQIAEVVEKASGDLSAEDVALVRKNAQAILAVLSYDQTALARLQALLENDRFADLNILSEDGYDLSVEELDRNANVMRWWDATLQAAQTASKEGPRRNDASACALVASVNHQLRSTVRLVLISRSTAMKDALKNWRALGKGPASQSESHDSTETDLIEWQPHVHIRHTRSLALYVALQRFEEDRHINFRGLLEELSESLAYLTSNESTRAINDDKQIKVRWRELVSHIGTQMGVSTANRGGIAQTWSEAERIALPILKVIGNSEAYKAQLGEAAYKAARSVSYHSQYATSRIRGRALAARFLTRDSLWMNKRDDKLTVDLKNYDMLYTLEFSSVQVQSWWDSAQRDAKIVLSEVLDLLQAGHQQDQTYEPLVTLSFYFGALGDWDTARHLASISTVVADLEQTEESRPPIDGHLFHAYAIRMLYGELIHSDSCDEAIQTLEQANARLESFYLRRGEEYAPDLRILMETATQILLWQHIPSLKVRFEEAIQLYDTVADRIKGSSDPAARKLLLLSRNNAAYALARNPATRHKEHTGKARQEFLQLLHAIYPDEGNTPVTLLDSKYWLEWLEVEGKPREIQDKKREELVRKYQHLISTNHPPSSKLRIYRRHRDKIARHEFNPE